MVTIENLNPNKTYTVSATVASSRYQVMSISSEQFSTLHVYYKPGNITQISPDRFTISKINSSYVDAHISWEPAYGMYYTDIYPVFK